MRLVAVCLLSSSLGWGLNWAPLQCGGEPEGELRRYETPGEALYGLAGQLKSKGNEAGWRDTLEYLIEHYPNSRFAERAKQDLAAQSDPRTDAK
jgi:hypothetical protein